MGVPSTEADTTLTDMAMTSLPGLDAQSTNSALQQHMAFVRVFGTGAASRAMQGIRRTSVSSYGQNKVKL